MLAPLLARQSDVLSGESVVASDQWLAPYLDAAPDEQMDAASESDAQMGCVGIDSVDRWIVAPALIETILMKKPSLLTRNRMRKLR